MICVGIALSGCANYHAKKAYEQALRQKDDAIQAFMASKTPLVKAGQMKRSDYYLGLFDLSQRPPVRPIDIDAADHANKAIALAKQFESGQIDEETYQAKLREIQIDFSKTRQELDDRDAQAQAQQNQVNRAMALQYYLQTRPVTTSCFGNTCTTR